MVQGYYTLEESAKILGISPEALKQMARKGEVRSFQDRGTWRFRIQDIQEMARRTGHGSDLELAVGEALTPMPTDSPAPRSPKPQKSPDDVFGFSLGDDEASVNLGADIAPHKTAGSSSGKKSSSSKRGLTSGSDSDVRLVSEGGSGILPLKGDSDVKLAEDTGPKSGSKSSSKSGHGSKSPKPSKGKTEHMATEEDSGVRLVPADSDSDVRISDSDDEHVSLDERPRKAGDSDIRLETRTPAAPAGPEGLLTEEIDLDEELEKEEARRREQKPRSKQRKPETPKKSPYDLSQSELHLDAPDEAPLGLADDSSSDFELSPMSEASPVESSEEFKLASDDDALSLVDEGPSDMKAPHSGINLANPIDSGISLEQTEDGTDEDYELTLEPDAPPPSSKSSTPKPGGSAKLVEADDSDSSEFELSLDADPAAPVESDSEFELTLDDAGSAEEGSEVQAQEQDIFETDFEVPTLDEESGSEAVAMDSAEADLASSDFDLDISEEESAFVDESGSEVVALDDETEIAPPKKKGKKKKKKGDEDDEVAELEDDEDIVVEDEEDAALVGAAAMPTAPWGVLPVAVLLPCVVVMVLIGMMGFELVQSQQGYKPGFLTKTITGLIDGKK